MKLIATALFESERAIVDADISEQMIVVLLKGKGERIVSINYEDVFSVGSHMYMLRIIDSELVLYDGQELHFYTLEGSYTRSVTVGRHVRHIEPMSDKVAITYTDQGVYDDPIGEGVINVVFKDGLLSSQRAFAEQHMLQYDICMAKAKQYACFSYENNAIVQFNEQFELVKVTACPIEAGNVLAMSYHYPYFLFIEENRFICLQEDGSFEAFEQSFSYSVRSIMHRGQTKLLETFEYQVVGYHVE